MNAKIHYTKPSITELEVEYATDAARNGWGPRCYDYINKFEAGFRAFAGTEFAIATSSCTGAMHMGLHALGIGPGDEVSPRGDQLDRHAAPIADCGATPAAGDCAATAGDRSGCGGSGHHTAHQGHRRHPPLRQSLRSGPAAGYRRGAWPRAYRGRGGGHRLALARPAGSIGRFGTFSFHGTKTMTTGEGGMFVTNDAALYESVLTLSNHGRSRHETRQFWPGMVGFKYKMSNIQAALGCAQLERIGELTGRKRKIFAAYRDGFAGMPVAMNPEPKVAAMATGCPPSFSSRGSGT